MCNVQFYLRPLMYLLFGLLKHRWVLLRLRLPQCRRFFHAGTQIHKGDPGRSGIWTLESGCRRGFELKLAPGLPSTEDHSYHRSSQVRLSQTRAPQHFWSRRDTHWFKFSRSTTSQEYRITQCLVMALEGELVVFKLTPCKNKNMYYLSLWASSWRFRLLIMSRRISKDSASSWAKWSATPDLVQWSVAPPSWSTPASLVTTQHNF